MREYSAMPTQLAKSILKNSEVIERIKYPENYDIANGDKKMTEMNIICTNNHNYSELEFEEAETPMFGIHRPLCIENDSKKKSREDIEEIESVRKSLFA